MKSTGRWVAVKSLENEETIGVRMLHTDRRGRYCVRYQRQWRLVEERRVGLGRTYVLGGTI